MELFFVKFWKLVSNYIIYLSILSKFRNHSKRVIYVTQLRATYNKVGSKKMSNLGANFLVIIVPETDFSLRTI